MLYEAAINSKYMHSAISFGVVKAKCVQRIMILLHGHKNEKEDDIIRRQLSYLVHCGTLEAQPISFNLRVFEDEVSHIIGLYNVKRAISSILYRRLYRIL